MLKPEVFVVVIQPVQIEMSGIGAGGGIRTPEGISRVIYSHMRLATSLPQLDYCN